MSRYNVKETEAKWQKAWDEAGCFAVSEDSARPKYYVLEMFPYPSGRIHMGHVRNYTIGDVIARYKRAKGFNVLHPMGWDAFGLPAENAAMERKIHPAEWTYSNISAMRRQLKSMGLSIDWARELATCHVGYYKYQQEMFLDFLEVGLAYRKESWVNWDPVDQTVLANEQVIDGRGWRSGAQIERRKLSQWFLRTTAFSDELLEALETLERWPERVRLMQQNWIGRSRGARIDFKLHGRDAPLEIFTTRPDTLFGASFMAISPHHPLAAELARDNSELAAFIAECDRLGTSEEAIETAEKQGFDTRLKALHPFLEGQELPVYVANFVLMEYGTGAIFGCPAHDQRDLDFARKYGDIRLSGARPARPGLRPQIRPAGAARGPAAGRRPGELRDRRRGLRRRRQPVQLRLHGRPPGAGCHRRRDRAAGTAGRRQGRGAVPLARLGHIPPALLGLSDSNRPLPVLRRRAGVQAGPPGRTAGGRELRRARQPPGPSSVLEAGRLSGVRRRGRARNRYHGYLRRFLLVLCPLLLAAR
jgi:leucyl-tRNA synthetase